MSRTIQPEDIRPGDKIRIIEEVTVGEVWNNGRSFSYIEDTLGPRPFEMAPSVVVQLIERPLNLPTELGAIVRVHRRSDDLQKTYVLFDEGGRHVWIDARHGGRFSAKSFANWIQIHGHQVEVIA